MHDEEIVSLSNNYKKKKSRGLSLNVEYFKAFLLNSLREQVGVTKEDSRKILSFKICSEK